MKRSYFTYINIFAGLIAIATIALQFYLDVRLGDAIYFNEVDRAQQSIRFLISVNRIDKRGNTHLHEAITVGCDYRIIQQLISRGADINFKNRRGNTPLHLAVWSENEEAVRLLVRAGADLAETDREGRTPLDLAEMLERKNITWYLRGSNAGVLPTELVRQIRGLFVCSLGPPG